jgi:exopolysaccharide biosynthesis protein
MVLYTDGSMEAVRLKDFDLAAAQEKGIVHAWQFGPIVIRNYEEGPDATKYGNMGFKARNILGYYEPGHYVIMTCDNSSKNAQGMNEYQMVAVMKSLGVKEAFNLDGGTSAVLVFMGEIINHPTMRSDHGNAAVGRPIVDMLVFGEYDENGNSPDLSTLTPAKCKCRD